MRAKTTKKSQELPKDTLQRIEDYLNSVISIRKTRKYSLKNILNMDETKMPLEPVPQKTIDLKGTKDVPIVLQNEKANSTAVLTVSAGGNTLKTMIIFKSKKKVEVQNPYDDIIIKNSDSGWMTGLLMVDWLKEVILPHVKKEKCLLVFDTYRGHLSEEFKNEILKHDNIDILLIPGGLTGLLQLLGISSNRRFKNRIRRFYMAWLRKKFSFIFRKTGTYEKIESKDHINLQKERSKYLMIIS